jgi:hypothetical protein
MVIAVGDPTAVLPWIRCQIGFLEDSDFICPDCERPICYDHGMEVNYEQTQNTIWVCIECVSGITAKLSEIPDEPLIIDSKTGRYINLVTRDQRYMRDGIDMLQVYINMLSRLFELE